MKAVAKNIIAETAVVYSSAPDGSFVDDCVSLDLANPEKPFRVRNEITACFAEHNWHLPSGFSWNGADIPWLWQWALRVSRFDPRVALASAFHDDMCHRLKSENVQRVIGDALFVSLLMPIHFNGRTLPGIGPRKAAAMYLGVRAYSGLAFVGANLWRASAVLVGIAGFLALLGLVAAILGGVT